MSSNSSAGRLHPARVLLVLCLFTVFSLRAQLTVTPGVSASSLMNALIGGGLNVSNVTLNCPTDAYGTFSNGNTTNIGLTNGILLTSGSALDAIGPNTIGSQGLCNGTSYADPQLTALEPLATNDPCILEFDLIPTCNNLQIRFVFGSEEYPEFVNAGYNDAFGFFITGPGGAGCTPNFYNNTNVATLPNNSTIVTIDNVNNVSNSTYYVDNTGGSTIQYDGFTTVLTRNVALCPCQSYHFKLAIADAGDCIYDSGVFVDFIACSSALAATGSITPASGCSSCDGTATVTASGGNPGYTYNWTPNVSSTATASNLCPGTYTCIVSDQGGCTVSQTVVLTVPSSGGLTPALASQTNVSCNGGSDGSATASATGGSGVYSYSWAPAGGNSATATGLSAGTYTCTITDSGGCTGTQTVTITDPPPISITTSSIPTACSGNTGSATATPSGGSGGYTYNWSPSGGTGATATGLGSGNYSVTVTDAAGCTATQTVAVTQINGLTSTQSSSNVLCFGGTTGSATVTPTSGNGPYTYTWSPAGGNSDTATNLGSGTYTCNITDSNGCTGSQTVTITEPPQLTATSSSTNISCFGGSDGSGTVATSGGTGTYTYNWSPSGGNSATASNLANGTYTCTITDANGCTTTQSVTITQPAQLSFSGSAGNITCFGGSNGSVTTNASGGTPVYSYSWTPNVSSTGSASNLPAGTYTVVLTDANGCTTQQSFTVTQPTPITTTGASTPVSCNGGTNGTASVNASGGTAGYTYSWSPSGGTGTTTTQVSAGTYTCTVTDANGCTTTQTVTITQPSALNANVSPNAVCAGTPATISATPSGGTSPYTYSWSNGPTTSSQTVTITTSTSYSVTITDANGCTTTASTTVTVNPNPTASITSNANDGILQLSNGTGNLCFTGPTAGVAGWLWDLNGTDTSTAQSPCVTVTTNDIGTYCANLIVVSPAGCFDTANICVEINNSFYSIPNVFTPNADGSNDMFVITNEGMKSLHCEIYDRWGRLVYEWDGTTGSWDGKDKSGNPCSDGVYYYTARLEDYTQKVYDEHGFVHLIKGTK